MKTWIHAIGVAALVSGAAQAQTVTENDARSYVLSAFITGAAPAILSEDVALAPDLRERLGLAAGADRNAIYNALIALTDGKPLKVSGSLKDVGDAITSSVDRPVLEVHAGHERLLVQYDLQANNIAYVGLPGTPAMAGGSANPPGALKVAAVQAPPAQPARVALAPVLFPFNLATLGEDAAAFDLDKLKRAVAIRLTGHADPLGESDYNLDLSRKRAEAVRERLVALGIDAARIDVVAAGAASTPRSCAQAKSRAERIACFAPERRVDVTAELPPL